jgi:hypothetical protein
MISTAHFRDKRTQNPKKIYSPSVESLAKPNNYLLFISKTVSYTIVGRTSVKSIQGTMATFVLSKKRIIGEIVFAGKRLLSNTLRNKYLYILSSGSFADCQDELNSIQKASQSIVKGNVIFSFSC